MTDQVLAAGTVLWRRPDGDDSLELAVVHRPKYDDWSLPKGKCEPGEHLIQTAVRETAEETGFTGTLTRKLGVVRYQVTGPDGPLPKTVHYWSMQALGGAFTPTAEVDRLVWLPPQEALDRLDRLDDRAPVIALTDAAVATTSVLLVRHGHAGDRKSWSGRDSARPLDAVGNREAETLARVLPSFGLSSVFAANLTRCRQTVAPLAATLGVAVEALASVSERNYGARPEEACKAILALSEGGLNAAVCSQGGVIPDLLRNLADRRTRRPHHRRSRKGSVWVLSFAQDRLVAADYLSSCAPSRPPL